MTNQLTEKQAAHLIKIVNNLHFVGRFALRVSVAGAPKMVAAEKALLQKGFIALEENSEFPTVDGTYADFEITSAAIDFLIETGELVQVPVMQVWEAELEHANKVLGGIEERSIWSSQLMRNVYAMAKERLERQIAAEKAAAVPNVVRYTTKLGDVRFGLEISRAENKVSIAVEDDTVEIPVGRVTVLGKRADGEYIAGTHYRYPSSRAGGVLLFAYRDVAYDENMLILQDLDKPALHVIVSEEDTGVAKISTPRKMRRITPREKLQLHVEDSIALQWFRQGASPINREDVVAAAEETMSKIDVLKSQYRTENFDHALYETVIDQIIDLGGLSVKYMVDEYFSYNQQ